MMVIESSLLIFGAICYILFAMGLRNLQGAYRYNICMFIIQEFLSINNQDWILYGWNSA